MRPILFFILFIPWFCWAYDEEVYDCIDLQSMSIEKECYNPSPNTPDYVYPYRKCYTRVELQIDEYPDPSDSGIRYFTTLIRERELIRLMGLGQLAFELPQECLPTE